jgi:hypothetical protein
MWLLSSLSEDFPAYGIRWRWTKKLPAGYFRLASGSLFTFFLYYSGVVNDLVVKNLLNVVWLAM